MPGSETTAALAAIISNIAKSHDPRQSASFKAQIAVNGSPLPQPLLPGEDSPEKETLERELPPVVVCYTETCDLVGSQKVLLLEVSIQRR